MPDIFQQVAIKVVVNNAGLSLDNYGLLAAESIGHIYQVPPY